MTCRTRGGPIYVVTVMRPVLPFVLAKVPTWYIQEESSKFEQFSVANYLGVCEQNPACIWSMMSD
jgi:hypothetical protein